MQFLPSFRGLSKPTKNLNEYCGSTLHRRGTLFQKPEGLCSHCNILEKHLEMIGRSKEVDRELSTVPTGSCNCVCVLGRSSTARCSAGRITTAINPKRLNAETWALGTGLFYLFALEKLTIEKEFLFFSPTLPGAQIVFCLRGPLAIRQ
ncbi:hypothetical protein AVEN_171469-1, partial [Araneus ventricosus]